MSLPGERKVRKWAMVLAVLLASTSMSVEAKKYDDKVYIYKVEDDKFSKSLHYVGLQELINPLGGTARRWAIRTWIDKDTKEVTHQLYVIISYFYEWRFYESAADDMANGLHFVSIDRELNGCQGMCSFTETVGVDLTDYTLREKALTGFQVKLFAKSGDSLVIDVTPAQIQSQLLTDNQYLPEDRRWSAPT